MRTRPGTPPPDDLAAFYADQYEQVRSTLALITLDRSLAEELAQEAFTKACQHWERVRTMDAPGAWVHRVAVNLAISRGRRRRTERKLDQRLRAVRPGSDQGDVADLAERVEVADEVRTALAGLAAEERAVVVLRFHADLSVSATAAALGWPEGTVKTRTRRALAALRSSGLVVDDHEPAPPGDGEHHRRAADDPATDDLSTEDLSTEDLSTRGARR